MPTGSQASVGVSGDALVEFAESYARERGFEVGSGAQHDISAAAFSAAKEIRLGLRSVEEFENNTALLIDEMIAQAGRIPGYASAHPGQIGEETLAGAFSSLCPLWPFCQ